MGSEMCIRDREDLNEAIEKEEAEAEADLLITNEFKPPPFLDKEYFIGRSGLLNRFFTWYKLVRVVARLLQIVNIWLRGVEATRAAKKAEAKATEAKKNDVNKNKKEKKMNKKPTRKSQRHEARVTELDLEEIAQAELFLFRLAQGLVWDKAVSYTHLTLPTIYSV